MAITHTVPDRRDATDPNAVIDPSLEKDSTAGLQSFINSTPPGSAIALPFDLVVNGGVVLSSDRVLMCADPINGKKKLIANETYPWRVEPDLRKTLDDGKPNLYYNPDGICAPWLMDVTDSIANPYGRPETHGAKYGGYDGTTGAAGADYDGKHLSTRLTAPFLPKHKGMGLRVMAYEGFSVLITGVSDDGKTVTFNDPQNVVEHESSTHTVAWAIQAKLGWSAVFTPNPAWKPAYWGNKDWHNYAKALDRATRNNRGRIILEARDTSTVIGVEAVGANDDWKQPIFNYDASKPAVTEFQHNIVLTELTGQAAYCYSHHSWGDGMGGPGHLFACHISHTGRQGLVGHFSGKRIDHCTIELTRRAAIDFETSKTIRDVVITNLTLGAGNGISISAPLVDCVFDRIHSTQEDVDAGRVHAVAPSIMRGAAHCGVGSKNVTYKNCEFDTRVDNFIVVHNVDGLHVFGNKANVQPYNHPTDGYFVKQFYAQSKADACINMDVHDNDGGPKCLGQIVP